MAWRGTRALVAVRHFLDTHAVLLFSGTWKENSTIIRAGRLLHLSITTIMTNGTATYWWKRGGLMGTDTWTVAKARAKLSEVITKAQLEGPQTITRHGRNAVIVLSADEWERKTKRKGNLAEFFAASPLRNSGLVIERIDDGPRPVDLRVRCIDRGDRSGPPPDPRDPECIGFRRRH